MMNDDEATVREEKHVTTKQQSVLSANIINHIGLVLDASGSMSQHRAKLIEVVDNQIAHLAVTSKEMDQETRISVWTFSDWNDIHCVVWDKDVLRLPSIAKYYEINGMTALVDAAMMSLDDMATTSQRYGNHSFLFYFVTDGYENNSRKYSREQLASTLKRLDDNVTAAALVPGPKEVMEAKKLGFPAGNVQIWDATTTVGLEKAGESITASTDAFMKARATTGLRSTTSLFDMSAAAVNQATIKAAGLTPLDPSEYILTTVVYGNGFQDGDDWISTYTTNVLGHQYVAGRGYYQLTLAPVKVQIQKDIAIVEKKSGKVYTGKNARALLGLPDMIVTLKAGQNPDYDIFIQSTSPNRKLLLGQRYLYLTPNVTYTKGQSVSPIKAVPKPHVAKMPPAPKKVAALVHPAASKKIRVDLTAPVYPKAGKALWAGIPCPVCPSKANKRCQKSDGSPLEKPHDLRKV